MTEEQKQADGMVVAPKVGATPPLPANPPKAGYGRHDVRNSSYAVEKSGYGEKSGSYKQTYG